jgi:hypothetical protein
LFQLRFAQVTAARTGMSTCEKLYSIPIAMWIVVSTGKAIIAGAGDADLSMQCGKVSASEIKTGLWFQGPLFRTTGMPVRIDLVTEPILSQLPI